MSERFTVAGVEVTELRGTRPYTLALRGEHGNALPHLDAGDARALALALLLWHAGHSLEDVARLASDERRWMVSDTRRELEYWDEL